MELKHQLRRLLFGLLLPVLIVPSGIETTDEEIQGFEMIDVLIVPSGIET